MTLNICCKNSHLPERKYILDYLVTEILGFEFELVEANTNELQIRCPEVSEHLVLYVADSLFAKSLTSVVSRESIPKRPLPVWRLGDSKINPKLTSNEIPVLYGEMCSNQTYVEVKSDAVHLGIDVFGSAFFMLSRMEEYLSDETDAMKRFPMKSSLSYQEGFLDRPIVNEYIEILWACMNHLWPNLERTKRQFAIMPSHDIDTPFEQYDNSFERLVRACLSDLLILKDPVYSVQRFFNWFQVKNGKFQNDFAYTYDALMDIEEQHQVKGAYYFITGVAHPKFTNRYPIEHPAMRSVLKNIHRRGHEIGIHGGHFTFDNAERLGDELKRVQIACREAGIEQAEWGGRQHNLQWNAPLTWRVWDDAGLQYDSSLTYSERPGFRCGICHEFPVFDVEQRKQLRLRERPLIVMEVSLLRSDYMALSYDKAMLVVHELKAKCNLFDGYFTVLWHNCNSKLYTRKNLLRLFQNIFKG